MVLGDLVPWRGLRRLVLPHLGLVSSRETLAMNQWPFEPLKMFHYGAVAIDPPWPWLAYSYKGLERSPQAHYDVMSFEEIAALPVADLCRPDCFVFVWCTWPTLKQAFDVLERWSLTYVSGGAWHKKTKGGKDHFGTGYVLRNACDPWLLARVGRPKPMSRSLRNIFEATAREHSRKPSNAHRILEALAPDVPKAEIFARESRKGWDTWGNESTKFDEEDENEQRICPHTSEGL